jgi:leucyl-tRNA synthetase
MVEQIDFKAIEEKWQSKWEKEKVFQVDESSKKPKYYVLEMFPYPSASGLHMGHALNYSIGDVFARFKRMSGFKVLYPMGFDAMGLPAENAAIKAGEHPKPFTENAIKNYIRQMKELGLSYDWSKTISTLDPEYYKWNQYFFLKFLEAGLIYRKKAAVNWCPKCNTVLANEQVQGGKCWRHEDTDAEIKHLEEWYMKTTKYADELLEGLKDLKWPDKIKSMQKNWIGKSHGTEIDFEINGNKWPIFTTRPDTIFGVTFMVVSAQHQKLMELVMKEQKITVEKFLKKLKSVSEKEMADMEKEGIFTGSYAINPANGDKVPVYAGNFVVAEYGAGMVMAVPAHDQRDFEFAKKYNIKIKEVIKGSLTEDRAYTGGGELINSKEFNGILNEEAKKKITDWLISKKVARTVVNYKLRDWGFSRQRYWGTPIPIINCDKCGLVPVPEKDLPVVLPEKVEFGKGNPLETNKEWVKAKCPKCSGNGRRETETMDTFFDSSWYFLRYPDNHNSKKPFDSKIIKEWLPVDQYIGGAEHACMHLIYSRFFVKVLRDLGFLEIDEPFISLFNQGMLHGPDGEKMSKSKGNIVNPDEVSKNYGMDTARFFLLSLASPDKPRDWSEDGIKGSLRFVRKIFDFYSNIKIGKSSEEINSKLNQTIKDATSGIETFEYRDGLIKAREFFNLMYDQKEVSKEVLETFLKILHPFCPHITEELWEKLGNKGFISLAEWPKAKEMPKEKVKKEDLNEKFSEYAKQIISKLESEGKKASKVYLYIMPFEKSQVDEKILSKKIGKEIKIFTVDDANKYDPENKSKKARPGMPGLFVE